MDSQENDMLVDNETYFDDDIDVVVPSPNNIVDENVKRRKGGNYSNDEDLILVAAWLGTSLDAINRTGQKKGTLWQRITDLYCENIIPNYIKRSDVSLNNRWQTLQKAVNKFQGCFAQIETRNTSGTNEADMINEAKLVFKKQLGSDFAFEHCWKVLRTQPKWMLRSSFSFKKRMYASCSPAASDVIDLGDKITPDKPLGYVERPLGRKAKKEALKKRKGKDSDLITDWKECKLEMYGNKMKMEEKKMKIFALNSKNKLKFKKEKIDLENKRLDLEGRPSKIKLKSRKKI